MALIVTVAPEPNEAFEAGEVIDTLKVASAFVAPNANASTGRANARNFLFISVAVIERSSGFQGERGRPVARTGTKKRGRCAARA